LKNHIDVGAGVIDHDYRGNVGVILFNHSSTDFKVSVGDRIAQLILERIAIADVVEVQQLENTFDLCQLDSLINSYHLFLFLFLMIMLCKDTGCFRIWFNRH